MILLVAANTFRLHSVTNKKIIAGGISLPLPFLGIKSSSTPIYYTILPLLTIIYRTQITHVLWFYYDLLCLSLGTKRSAFKPSNRRLLLINDVFFSKTAFHFTFSSAYMGTVRPRGGSERVGRMDVVYFWESGSVLAKMALKG